MAVINMGGLPTCNYLKNVFSEPQHVSFSLIQSPRPPSPSLYQQSSDWSYYIRAAAQHTLSLTVCLLHTRFSEECLNVRSPEQYIVIYTFPGCVCVWSNSCEIDSQLCKLGSALSD